MFDPITVAGMVCPNNVFLAPLAGYTNYPFRKMCLSLGAGLTFTEMVSCKGLLYGSEETEKLLLCGAESPKAVQIFGNDPAIMRTACESEALAPFDLIDINMGCPMPKITGPGAAHINIKARRVQPGQLSGGMGHAQRLRAKNLQKHRPLVLGDVRQGGGFFIVILHGLGADHLADRISRAQPLAHLPERRIRYPGHGGQGGPALNLNAANFHMPRLLVQCFEKEHLRTV